jgi:hypothetical protein
MLSLKQNQRTRGQISARKWVVVGGGVGGTGEGKGGTMYTHVSKCKNLKIK